MAHRIRCGSVSAMLAQRRSVPLIPHADKYVVGDAVPGVVNADEEQQQRRSSHAAAQLNAYRASTEMLDRIANRSKVPLHASRRMITVCTTIDGRTYSPEGM